MTQKAAVSYQQHPWTFRLIGLNACIFLVVELTTGVVGSNPVFFYGAFDPVMIVDGQWWRLITSTLLHANFVHLIFNMIAMLIFGSMLESLIGGALYLLVYFLGGILANVVVLLILIASNQEYLALGASGSIMAVIGASFSCALYLYSRTKQYIWKRFFTQMAIILLIQAIVDVFLPQNSMMTHLAGGVMGMLLGMFVIVLKLQSLRISH